MNCRFPKNISGDFYTTGEKDKNDQWSGCCLACGLPEDVAPSLFAPLDDENYDTYFVRQPKTPDEVAQAIVASEVCCVEAVRYGGREKEIIRKMNPRLTDFILDSNRNVVENTSIENSSIPNKR